MMNTQPLSTQKTVVQIGGMGCSGCASSVQKALENTDGIQSASVDLENETASITFNPNSASIDNFKQAIEEAGYTFKGVK